MPLGGAKSILTKLRKQLADDNFEPPALVIVTGNVVTFQPGQLDYETHLQTIQEVYKMLKEVFHDSFVFPVMGSNDFFPQNYSPMNTTSNINWKYMTVKDLYR